MSSRPWSNTEKDCSCGLKWQPHWFSHPKWASSQHLMDWLALHIGVRCPATSESRGDQTSIQALYLRLCRKCMGKSVYSGVKVTTLDQLPSILAPTVKYFVMFDMHVACGVFICLQWGWVPLWQGDSGREQSHLQIKMCHLSILVAPIRFSLTNKFSRIFTTSHYEHATKLFIHSKRRVALLLIFTPVLFVLHIFCFQGNWKPHKWILMLQPSSLSLGTDISNFKEF